MQSFTVPDQCECVATDPVRGGLQHRQRHGGRHSGVDGIAALAQHLQASLRRKRLRGSNDTVHGHHRHAP